MRRAMWVSVLDRRSVTVWTRGGAVKESGRLVRVPGIGKKTAGRLLLELKGRLAQAIGPSGGTPLADQDQGTDILRALLALGYSEREAGAAARQVPAGTGVSEGIKHALKHLARN